MIAPTWQILHGNVLQVLPTLPAGSVHCVVTSPPYWGLRDYGTARWEGGDPQCPHRQIVGEGRTPWANAAHGPNGQAKNPAASQKVKLRGGVCAQCGARRIDEQLGMEAVLDCLGWATGQPCDACYVCHMVAVFEQVRRVLRADGTLWLNLGDSYNGSGGAGEWSRRKAGKQDYAGPRDNNVNRVAAGPLKPKDLCGVPWRVALALQAAGWYLRGEIVWSKTTPMPESVQDRPTRAHEQIFLFAKSERYYYDQLAVAEPAARAGDVQTFGGAKARNGQANGGDPRNGHRTDASAQWGRDIETGPTRNLRDVWHLGPDPYPQAHFATFPREIPRRAILAGTSAVGCCPACGAPYQRVVVKTPAPPESWHGSRFDDGKNLLNHANVGRREDAATASTYPEGSSANRLALLRQQSRQNGAEYANVPQTTGWQPTCACHAGDPVPCVCLDPFAGSGTTLAVALSLGRSSIGVELNPAYIVLAQQRLAAVTPPLPNLATIIQEES